MLPGAGLIYCERYYDSILAFALNGLTAWAAVVLFMDRQYLYGGLVSLLEAGWYGGAIYHSVDSAHKFNRDLQDTMSMDFKRKMGATEEKIDQWLIGIDYSY